MRVKSFSVRIHGNTQFCRTNTGGQHCASKLCLPNDKQIRVRKVGVWVAHSEDKYGNVSPSNFSHYIVIIIMAHKYEKNTNLQISLGISMKVKKENHSSHHL